MAPIIPSTTATITVGNVGTTLGNATKNMGGFRGFGGSVPASGALSMSQCQIIQYGVGYYNSWFLGSAVTNQGTWSSTAITNNGSFTYAVWVASSQLNNWRNVVNVNTSTADGSRRPSLWIYAYDTGFHVRHDTSAAGNEGIGQTTSRIAMNGSVYQVVVTQNGTNMRAYLNGSLSDSITLAGTPTNALTTDIVASPGAGVAGASDYALNYLWFFPYPMTATQVSSYYSSLSGSIGTPPMMNFVITFTSSSSWTASGTGNIRVLVVAGGGGGASGNNRAGGGGGAGGVVYCTSFPVTKGTVYTVTVGAGGAGGVGTSTPDGSTGSNSAFSTITALGGGGGGGNYDAGKPGGSGGGGAQRNYAGGAATQPGQSQPANCTNYGNAGGVTGVVFQAGGGGGAGGVGGSQTGGTGVSINITGTATYYGGGGGGAYQTGGGTGTNGGAGGAGGGGAASQGEANATAGTPNTGGGGGGACSHQSPYTVYNGGSGGSGVVIIAYP